MIDLSSRRVVGLAMADHLRASLAAEALEMALAQRRPAAGLVHHSDRGSQYASLAFGATLRESGLLASTGSRGDAYDAAAERFMATIKKEQEGAHLPPDLQEQERGAARDLRLRRSLLQPAAAALDARSDEPRRLRAGRRYGDLMRG